MRRVVDDGNKSKTFGKSETSFGSHTNRRLQSTIIRPINSGKKEDALFVKEPSISRSPHAMGPYSRTIDQIIHFNSEIPLNDKKSSMNQGHDPKIMITTDVTNHVTPGNLSIAEVAYTPIQ